MKVLIDVHATIEKKTGVGRYCSSLVKNLSKFPKKQLMISLYTNTPEDKLPHHYAQLPYFRTPHKNGLVRILYGLNKASMKLKPNLLHVNFFAPLIKTVPIVNTVHDICYKNRFIKYPIKSRIVFKFFFKRSLSLSDAIICVSNTTKNALIKHYKVDPNKISVIYEGIDTTFKYLKSKKLVKKKLKEKFEVDKRYFLVVGNIEHRKKPLETMAAFNKLTREKVQLVFVGPNLLKQSSLQKYKKQISCGGIKILEFVSDEDLNMLYNGAISLLYNSHCEGFGLPLVEAMRCKTPIICSDIDVFREITNNSAVYFKSEKELILAMQKMLSNRRYRQRYALSGYKRSQNFSWEKAAEETLKVYTKLI